MAGCVPRVAAHNYEGRLTPKMTYSHTSRGHCPRAEPLGGFYSAFPDSAATVPTASRLSSSLPGLKVADRRAGI